MGRNKTLNRREFISMAIGGIGTAGLTAFSKGTSPLLLQPQTAGNAKGPILARPLGKTGIRLPVVNMGVMNARSPDLVRRSIELGVRHFDTAAVYARGGNEQMLGTVFEELKARDKIVIGTKVLIPHQQRPQMSPDQAKAAFLRQFEGSLARLKTDHVDILYIQDARTPEDIANPGFREALAEARQQKKTRFIGYSVHTGMKELLISPHTEFFDVILTAFNYAMSDDPGLVKALRDAAAKGIGLIAMKTQCAQFWYRDEYVTGPKLELYSGNVHQTAVLKWVLRHDFITCAVPGCTTFSQMEEDFSVAGDLSLTPEEKKFLDDRKVRMTLNYCLQCGGCLGSCPRGAEVPAMMRAYLYGSGYADKDQAAAVLETISPGKGLKACASCERCEARCRRRIDIGGRIAELKSLFA